MKESLYRNLEKGNLISRGREAERENLKKKERKKGVESWEWEQNNYIAKKKSSYI